jgi:hypothetical protein
MKTLRTLIVCISLMSFLGCDKEKSEGLINVDVNRYVELLKEGKYDALELPAFTYKDIPALLEYRNEHQLITKFPVNGISSMGMLDCSLGMYVLWTVESIRAVAIDSEYLIGRFPSQNPIVQKRTEPFGLEYNNEVHEIVSKAYYDWWEENKSKEFDEFKNIDPLMDTEYRWH